MKSFVSHVTNLVLGFVNFFSFFFFFQTLSCKLLPISLLWLTNWCMGAWDKIVTCLLCLELVVYKYTCSLDIGGIHFVTVASAELETSDISLLKYVMEPSSMSTLQVYLKRHPLWIDRNDACTYSACQWIMSYNAIVTLATFLKSIVFLWCIWQF